VRLGAILRDARAAGVWARRREVLLAIHPGETVVGGE
jgi:hypothetical protein